MEIDIDQHNNLRLKEIYNGILLETQEGNQIGICMRDDTLEINVCPGGKNTDNWWRVNMQIGIIEQQSAEVINVEAQTQAETTPDAKELG